jgi:extracellular factor (EF) 3-hydroxypalmitic acid methyl ester biosynthesis protein
MTRIQARLPRAFHDRLGDLQNWLAALAGERLGEKPKPGESTTLEQHFRGLWEATGMDATMGLCRSTPDHRLFRSAIGSYLWQSTLVQRCFEKPRGYAGDYLMMDAACNEPPKAASSLGRWMNRWFYETFPPSPAARGRRDMMARVLATEYQRGARRVFNVACGGVPELVRICGTTAFDDIVLLDQDAEALAFANASLKAKCPDIEVSTRITTLNLSVQAVVRCPEVIGPAKFDVVYSMGLYDYLPEERARKLTATLWDAVAPGGLLAIGNFQGHEWWRYVLEAAMDWFLVYRDEDELAALAEDLPDSPDVDIVCDATGSLFMLLARKQ